MPVRVVSYPRVIFQAILLLGFAGTCLSGCIGKGPAVIPSAWNIPAPADMRTESTNPVSRDEVAGSSQTSASSSIPLPPSLAAFLATRSTLPSGPIGGLIGGLQRQADCSLTYFDYSYEPRSTAASLMPNSQVPHYEKMLHDNALLKTAPARFLTGCTDPTLGITSRPFLFLGTAKNGRELVAVLGDSFVVTSGLKSDGTFTEPVTQRTPIKSVSLLTADLNSDGNADLITINSDAVHSSVTVFLGRGDGTFETGINYGLPGANAQYGVLDDLNGDGIPDLLVSSDSPTFAFSIFLGNGDGTFQPPRTFAPASPNLHSNYAFLTTDVNGDGFKDIVTAQEQIFLGTRDGTTYTALPQAAFPPIGRATNRFAPSIVAADFNKDGKIDLATDNGTTIRTYQGNGDGTFSAGPAYSTIPNYGFLLATDLDGDGNIDLWTGYGGNGVYGGDAYLPNVAYALMGNGDGTFTGVPGLPVIDSSTTAAAKRHADQSGTSLVLGAPSPSKISVVAGQVSPPFTVNVTGTSQSVTFACSGLPAGASCMFSPSPFMLTSSVTSQLVTVTIATISGGLTLPGRPLQPPLDWTNLQKLLAFILAALSAVLFAIRRKNLGWMVSACLLLVVLTALTGCKGSNSNSTTYAVTVTGNGTASTPSTLTLTVIPQ